MLIFFTTKDRKTGVHLMVNLFRSFFMITFFAATIGIFMVGLVHVVSDTSPDFAKLPEPTAYNIDASSS